MAGLPPMEREVTGRGFTHYDHFIDSYGAEIRVAESSSAEGPHIWVWTEGGSITGNKGSAHLSLMQALQLRRALSEAISDALAKWGDGLDPDLDDAIPKDRGVMDG